MVSLVGIWLGELAFLWIWIYGIAVYFLSGVIKNRAPELKSLRRYYIGFFFFLLFVGTCGVIHWWYEWNLFIFGTEIWAGIAGTSQNLYFYILVTFLQAGFTILSFQIEKYIRQSKKYPFTIMLFVSFIISLLPYFFLNERSATNDNYIIFLVNGTLGVFFISLVYWGIYYLKLGHNTAGIVKKRSYAVAFGLGFLFGGILLDVILRQFLGTDEAWKFLPSVSVLIISILGVPLLFFGFQRKID
ncbi:MAG: hypothetical protein ACTSU5_00485 [Promethearchaeota archaeon]